MTKNSFDTRTIEALFQLAKEFNTTPDEDLVEIGTTRSAIDAWKTSLRVVRNAFRDTASPIASEVYATGCDVILSVPMAVGQDDPPSTVRIEAAQGFYAVSDHLISMMGDKEIFLRTGFYVDELRAAAHRVADLVGDSSGHR